MRILFLKAGPSFAQLEAGNYPKERLSFDGLPVSIENARGTERRGRDRGGKPWSTTMPADYGYIRGTVGADGDHYDVFVGPDLNAPTAYVIETAHPPDFTRRDEEKAMLGFPSEAAARAAFGKAYDNPGFLRRLVAMPLEDFKRRVRASRSTGGRVL